MFFLNISLFGNKNKSSVEEPPNQEIYIKYGLGLYNKVFRTINIKVRSKCKPNKRMKRTIIHRFGFEF